MKLIEKYSINCNTCIYRDLLEQYGLVNKGQLMKNSE